MSTKTNQRSRVQIHLLRKNKVTSASLRYPLSVFNKNSTVKPTSGQRNKSDSRTKYLDKPVRKPKEIETCDKSGVF